MPSKSALFCSTLLALIAHVLVTDAQCQQIQLPPQALTQTQADLPSQTRRQAPRPTLTTTPPVQSVAQTQASSQAPMARQSPSHPPALTPVSHKLHTPHIIDPAIQLAMTSLQHIRANVQDYEAILVKRCRVGGVLPEPQYAKVKIRNRKTLGGAIQTPMSVYLRFLKPTDVSGREVVWVENQNNGNMIVHESGLKGMVNVTLDPNGYLAMRNQRYPITEIGIENLAKKLIERCHRDRQHDECDFQLYNDAKIAKRECRMLEVVHPNKRPHFDFYRARVYIDKELNLPIRYASWSWPTTAGGEPVLEEEYTYLRVKANAGLTDQDFDIDNPAYGFR
ncbi:DUF1571 domain-containing protein [Planctomycetes bacterium K23_9]|uniref:DUF1571 domain-containing protein n=1 Tax=Stieleria marina TaxID=1930275 RepID=A0A517NW24_9BACT|nr:hypothetical protein K239x_33220 [Planctomycetes bacterium K23_9]